MKIKITRSVRNFARQILADELREMGKEINAANRETAAVQRDRRTLSEFIAVIDPEAKRAGLWKLIDKGRPQVFAAEERPRIFLGLRETLECAASDCTVILEDLDIEEGDDQKKPAVTYTFRRRLTDEQAKNIVAGNNVEAIRMACQLFGDAAVHSEYWTPQAQKDGRLAQRILFWANDDASRSVKNAIAELLRYED